MGRKALTKEELERTYDYIVNYLILHSMASADELVEVLGISKGKLSKSLQYGRRQFPEVTRVENLVLGSPKGYFIPDNKKEVIAWYMQYEGFAHSLLKTIDGVGNYLQEKYPEDLAEAKRNLIESDETEDDPWGIFNNLLQED